MVRNEAGVRTAEDQAHEPESINLVREDYYGIVPFYSKNLINFLASLSHGHNSTASLETKPFIRKLGHVYQLQSSMFTQSLD